MTSRCTSLVPSQIRSTRSSRRNRSATLLRMYPRPPKIWTARSAHRPAASDTNSFAIEALAWISLTSAPASTIPATWSASRRPSAASVAESASGNDTPW